MSTSFIADPETLVGVEKLLGRSIEDERGSIASYAEFTTTDITACRTLVRGFNIGAITYILHKLDGKDGLANAASFVENVIKNELDLQVWLSDFYVPR